MTDQTLLHRQINPQFVQAGRVGSIAFRPSREHQMLLSVYDGDKITAERAWTHFTSDLKLQSAGCMAVTVDECSVNQLDARPDTEFFPEHSVIDFSAFGTTQVTKKAKLLCDAAQKRGWQFREA